MVGVKSNVFELGGRCYLQHSPSLYRGVWQTIQKSTLQHPSSQKHSRTSGPLWTAVGAALHLGQIRSDQPPGQLR